MKRKTILDSIDVPKPCSASWDEMTGGDEVRFCLSCEKDIYNLSAMSRQKAEKLVKDSSGKICVRYEKNSQGKIITAPPKLTQITRRATIAAGVLSTTLSLSAMSYAQGEPIIGKVRSKNTEEKVDEKNNQVKFSSISGYIKDAAGASIKASLLLRNVKKNNILRRQTEEDGFYKFDYLEVGIYELEIEAIGFKKAIYTKVEILKDSILKKDIVLEIGEPTIYLLPDTDYSQTKPNLYGVIFDQNGAVISNAKLILKNKKTKKSFTIHSKEDGSYQFINIESGNYELSIERQLFKKVKIKDFKISEDSKIEKDFILEGRGGITIGLLMFTGK